MSLGSEAMEALNLCDRMRADGVPDVEIYATLERWLRARWVYVREWKYLCESCRDSGAVVKQCPSEPCDRDRPHGPHDYIRPCGCSRGDAWRPRPRTADTAIAVAAKVRPMTRVGR